MRLKMVVVTSGPRASVGRAVETMYITDLGDAHRRQRRPDAGHLLDRLIAAVGVQPFGDHRRGSGAGAGRRSPQHPHHPKTDGQFGGNGQPRALGLSPGRQAGRINSQVVKVKVVNASNWRSDFVPLAAVFWALHRGYLNVFGVSHVGSPT